MESEISFNGFPVCECTWDWAMERPRDVTTLSKDAQSDPRCFWDDLERLVAGASEADVLSYNMVM